MIPVVIFISRLYDGFNELVRGGGGNKFWRAEAACVISSVYLIIQLPWNHPTSGETVDVHAMASQNIGHVLREASSNEQPYLVEPESDQTQHVSEKKNQRAAHAKTGSRQTEPLLLEPHIEPDGESGGREKV